MHHIKNEAAWDAARTASILANARKTFYRTYPDAGEVVTFICSGRNEDGGYTDNFVGSLMSAFDRFGKLSEKQVEAVRKIIAQRAARKVEWADKEAALNATRVHLGTVGEKIELTLTTRHVVELDGIYGVSYIYICEDADKNVVIYKGTSRNFPDKGETMTVKATVKDHGVRDGVKQTIIQRPKLIEV